MDPDHGLPAEPGGLVSTPALTPRLRVVPPVAQPPWPRRAAEAWTTPVQLWSLLGAVGVSALLLLLAVTAGMADSRQAFKTVGSDSVPSINYALDAYFALSDMDADAANYLLVSQHPTPNLSRAEALSQYEQRRQVASDRLVSAAQNITYGDRERKPILRMTAGLQQFDADVARAELLSDLGDRAGALAAYRDATDLMHDSRTGLLKSALDLANANHDALTAGYESARATEGRDVVLIVLSGLLLLASLTALQLLLVSRMRRAVNLPVLAATGLTLALSIGAVSTLAANDRELKIAKQDAYDSVYALRQARATAFDANADESRYLVDPQRAQVYQQAFLTKTLTLTTFPQPVTLATYDAALAQALAELQAGRTPPLKGAFGTAFGNITFTGEPSAARAVLETYAAYQRDDRTLRADVASGNLNEAVRFDTSPAPNDSDGHFNAFDAALGTWIQINQSAFDRAVAAGMGNLSGWQVYPALAMLLVVALTFAGLRPRLGEYR
jgi:hypothetical protein